MMKMRASGYLHRAYADCFSAWGEPLELPCSGGRILTRAIPGTGERDAMGCYPIFCCERWAQLRSDLEGLKDLVCVSMVTDPFGDWDGEVLRECFPDLAIPFKAHFVADLTRNPREFVSGHHLRNVERAFRSVRVSRCEDAAQYSEEWVLLYRHLIERHSIRGISAFSDDSLRRQLGVPGIEMFRGSVEGEAAGMALWAVQGEIAYYHLGAYSEAGYRERASFALFWTALEYFAQKGVRWVSLGAGAGLQAAVSGLTRFKQGWSTAVRMTYLCGRILDSKAYGELTARKGAAPDGYFPSYRRNEFG